MEIPIPEEAKEKLLQHLTLEQIKWLALINPTFLLIGALTFGTLLYDKVKLRVPIIEGLLQKKETHFGDDSEVGSCWRCDCRNTNYYYRFDFHSFSPTRVY